MDRHCLPSSNALPSSRICDVHIQLSVSTVVVGEMRPCASSSSWLPPPQHHSHPFHTHLTAPLARIGDIFGIEQTLIGITRRLGQIGGGRRRDGSHDGGAGPVDGDGGGGG